MIRAAGRKGSCIKSGRKRKTFVLRCGFVRATATKKSQSYILSESDKKWEKNYQPGLADFHSRICTLKRELLRQNCKLWKITLRVRNDRAIVNVNVNVSFTKMKDSQPKTEEKTWSISDLANELEVSPRTLRFYEEKRLLSPSRTEGNQRVFTKRDRARLKLILRGKRFGYTLDEIAEMIGMTDVDMTEVDQIQKSLAYGESKLLELRSRMEELKLMEQDLLEVREKLFKRLKELESEDITSRKVRP